MKNTTTIQSNITFVIKEIHKPRPWDFGEITLLILLIIGTIHSFLIIMVMRSKRMKSSNASLFVICMAVSDFLLLFLKFTANMIKIYRISIYNFCIVIQVIPQAAQFISVWLIILTSLERTIAVLLPLQVASIFSRKRSKLLITSMVVFFLLMSSTTSICIHYSEDQPYYCKIRGNQNGACFYYYTFIFPWLKSAFGSWLPSILGICLNLIIISALYKASKNRKNITNQRNIKNTNTTSPANVNKLNTYTKNDRINSELLSKYSNESLNLMTGYKKVNGESEKNEDKKSNSGSHANEKFSSQLALSNTNLNQINQTSHSKERQITIMLLTISITFIMFTLPYSTFELLRKLGFKSKILKNRNVMRFVMLLIDINHAINFILYCLTAQRFRQELKMLFFKFFKCYNSKNDNTYYTNSYYLSKAVNKNYYSTMSVKKTSQIKNLSNHNSNNNSNSNNNNVDLIKMTKSNMNHQNDINKLSNDLDYPSSLIIMRIQ